MTEYRTQIRKWFVELGTADGTEIGAWMSTDESVEVGSREEALALRDEWLASGKLTRNQWDEIRSTAPYGLFRIRDRWVDVPREVVAVRHSFDGNGWLYADAGNGSDWLERAREYPDAEELCECRP